MRPTSDEYIHSGKGCDEHRRRGNAITGRLAAVKYCVCNPPSNVHLLSMPPKCGACHLPFRAGEETDELEPVDPLTERTCIAAFCLNEHDALPDTVRIESAPAAHQGIPAWNPPWSTWSGVLAFGLLIAACAANLYEMRIAMWVCVVPAVVLACCAYRWRE